MCRPFFCWFMAIPVKPATLSERSDAVIFFGQ